MKFTLRSNSFEHYQTIPVKYTCDGENISPPLEWENSPEGTKSFVLIFDDPDAPNGTWDHWLIYNIPQQINKLEEDIKSLSEPARVGVNSWEEKKYGGPCPPDGEHRYYFKLYALDEMLTLHHKATKAEIEETMKHHILSEAVLIGKYNRTGRKETTKNKFDIEDAVTILRRKDVSPSIKEKAIKEIEKDALDD